MFKSSIFLLFLPQFLTLRYLYRKYDQLFTTLNIFSPVLCELFQCLSPCSKYKKHPNDPVPCNTITKIVKALFVLEIKTNMLSFSVYFWLVNNQLDQALVYYYSNKIQDLFYFCNFIYGQIAVHSGCNCNFFIFIFCNLRSRRLNILNYYFY